MLWWLCPRVLFSIAVWEVHEQLFLAALDCRLPALAEHHLNVLKKQFPGSQRVANLELRQMEVAKPTRTMQALLTTLQANPGHLNSLHRVIALHTANGDHGKAVEMLHELVKFIIGGVSVGHDEILVGASCGTSTRVGVGNVGSGGQDGTLRLH